MSGTASVTSVPYVEITHIQSGTRTSPSKGMCQTTKNEDGSETTAHLTIVSESTTGVRQVAQSAALVSFLILVFADLTQTLLDTATHTGRIAENVGSRRSSI